MEPVDDPDAASGAAEVTFDAGGVPVIKLSGEIDMSNVELLRTSIEPAITRAPDRVIFDLSALEFMDSSGIALLLNVAAAATAVEIRQPSAIVRRIVEATGLSDVLRIVE
jgi:anti-sigma B factor antagonist